METKTLANKMEYIRASLIPISTFISLMEHDIIEYKREIDRDELKEDLANLKKAVNRIHDLTISSFTFDEIEDKTEAEASFDFDELEEKLDDFE